ncbi:hypothetical protein GCM10010964_05790 [Caldovatus sediminis]|uniref:Insertion element IS402-like domain-containing protein n=1 Tax=Caldovatus sediminis TaxID=2041189 RepID=A0A8J2Z8J5_9PROT|nr:transposase [Caldovatus sediminis]GGG20416.1 hypothetical protein GCM10010964_05790 [Caldovatus sediminis]
MAEPGPKTRRHPSDLTDEDWVPIEPLMAKPARRGRKPSAGLREVLNAIRCLAPSAGGWRVLPVHFGPWRTVPCTTVDRDASQAGVIRGRDGRRQRTRRRSRGPRRADVAAAEVAAVLRRLCGGGLAPIRQGVRRHFGGFA